MEPTPKPAIGAIAAKRSALAEPMLRVIMEPLEWPVMYSRVLSMWYSASVLSRIAFRQLTSVIGSMP